MKEKKVALASSHFEVTVYSRMLSNHYLKFMKFGTFFLTKNKLINLFVLEYCTFKYWKERNKK